MYDGFKYTGVTFSLQLQDNTVSNKNMFVVMYNATVILIRDTKKYIIFLHVHKLFHVIFIL